MSDAKTVVIEEWELKKMFHEARLLRAFVKERLTENVKSNPYWITGQWTAADELVNRLERHLKKLEKA